MGENKLGEPELYRKKALFHLENAIATPTTINYSDMTFTGCVYDESGRIVTASQRTSREVLWKPVDPVTISRNDPAVEIEGQCVYLGHYTSHYGHFLLETLSRFWSLSKKISIDKYVFQPFVHNVPHPLLFPPAKVCFECFGINPDNVLLINRRMMFRRLIVPTTLFEIFNYADEEQALIYNKIADYCESRYEQLTQLKHHDACQRVMLYLSRKNFKELRSIANENEVEQLFASLGFRIVYPEKMGFEEQVALYRKAEVIAGFQGSGMHNSVFMNKDALAINIGDLMQPNIVNRNQQICDAFSKVKSAFIKFNGHIVDQRRNIGMIDIPYLRSALEQFMYNHFHTQII